MAKVGADLLFSKNGDERRITGRALGGSGVVSAVANSGRGWSVSYVSTGKYRVTLDNPFQKFFGADATVMSSTLGRSVQCVAYNTTNRTFDFTVFDSNSKAATDLGASDELWFEVCVGWSQRS